MRILGLTAVLSLLAVSTPIWGQEPAVERTARESVVFAAGISHWDAGSSGIALARALIAYEYRRPDGLGFHGEVGLGFRSSGSLWVLVPGVSMLLEPRRTSSVLLLGGLSVLDTGLWGINAGVGWATTTFGDGFRFLGRVHVLGTASKPADSFILEALVAYSFSWLGNAAL